ncbi:MAG: OB-fold putative lipoprotein [Gemmataceae bacterium]|nr:OB-fold putative lipoprotein [Gemmataceae bacterium]
MRTLSLAAALLMLAGCGQTNPSGKEGKEGKAPPAKLGEAEFKVSSADFVAEWKKDSKAALSKYKGKTVEVTGKVSSIGTNLSGDPVILLESAPMKFDWTTCLPVERFPAKSLAPGQTATIKGRVHPDTFSAGLVDAEVVKAEGPKAQAFTADELADEVGKSGFDEAMKKHKDKWMLVSGEVAEVKLDKARAGDVVLKTKGKGPKIVARFSAMDEKSADALKKAKRIEVLGQYSDLTVDKEKNEVGLFNCVPASEPK